MSATYTLASTSFAAPVSKDDIQVKVASTAGLTPGMRLFADRESMLVVSLPGYANLVNVRRGVDGTQGERHGTEVTVWEATGAQLYSSDPVGRPREDLLVSPWINVRTGDVWFAQGDDNPTGRRWWEKQSTARAVGPLGVRTATQNPTSST